MLSSSDFDPNETMDAWKEGVLHAAGQGAGISNAFCAAYGSRTAPVDVEQCRHSGIGCIGRGFI
jgi:hypothetical protein